MLRDKVIFNIVKLFFFFRIRYLRVGGEYFVGWTTLNLVVFVKRNMFSVKIF